MGGIIVVSVVCVQYFVYNNATDFSVCVHNVTGDSECCNDYRNVSGKCEKCIGLFGKKCTINALMVTMDMAAALSVTVQNNFRFAIQNTDALKLLLPLTRRQIQVQNQTLIRTEGTAFSFMWLYSATFIGIYHLLLP